MEVTDKTDRDAAEVFFNGPARKQGKVMCDGNYAA
jgi:hypothetical protein